MWGQDKGLDLEGQSKRYGGLDPDLMREEMMAEGAEAPASDAGAVVADACCREVALLEVGQHLADRRAADTVD